MNKNDLISEMANKTNMSKNECNKALDALMEVVEGALKKGDEVRLIGFGTFYVSHRAATEGRNPRTGEKIKISAKKSAKFRAGKPLNEGLN